MPKAVKTTTDAPAPTPVVAEKAPKTPRAPKVAKDASTVAVKAPKAAKKEASAAAAAAPVSDSDVADVAVDVESSFVEKSDEFVSRIQQVTSLLSTLKADFRALQKQFVRDLKTAQKQNSKRKRKAGTRSPSGFVKPTRISDELASFLDKPSGTEMARTDVTRDINKYIRTHNLQDSANGRKINPDTKLAGLLKLKADDELTYFNLQKYMSPHFAKAVKAVASSV
jgi:upstream activation factor subunit UAF30